MIYTTHYPSPVGDILLAEREGALIGLWIEGQKYFLGSLQEEIAVCDDRPVFSRVKNWLDRYFAGEKPAVSAIPLAPAGSEFRRQVWDILCEIPYGEVTTYGEIAKQIARKRGVWRMSAQAVGGAVGHNPVSIIIPCHRVVGTNGSLTGYAGGLDKKIKLLTLEGVNMEGFFCPKRGRLCNAIVFSFSAKKDLNRKNG